MSNVTELKANIELYKKLRKEAETRVKTAVQKAEQIRINQKARQNRQA